MSKMFLISPRTVRRWAEPWTMLADTPRHLTQDRCNASTYAAESVRLDIYSAKASTLLVKSSAVADLTNPAKLQLLVALQDGLASLLYWHGHK